jgi:hypothetical protein
MIPTYIRFVDDQSKTKTYLGDLSMADIAAVRTRLDWNRVHLGIIAYHDHSKVDASTLEARLPPPSVVFEASPDVEDPYEYYGITQEELIVPLDGTAAYYLFTCDYIEYEV